MYEERNGRPGRRYDDMTEQEKAEEAIDRLWDEMGIIENVFKYQSPVVTGEMIEKLRIARDQWNANQDKAAFENLGAAIDQLVAIEPTQSQGEDDQTIGEALEIYHSRQSSPTQAPEDDNEKLERYDREIQQALTAPAPAELEVARTMLVERADALEKERDGLRKLVSDALVEMDRSVRLSFAWQSRARSALHPEKEGE